MQQALPLSQIWPAHLGASSDAFAPQHALTASAAVVVQAALSQTLQAHPSQLQSPPTQQLQPASQTPHGQVSPAAVASADPWLQAALSQTVQAHPSQLQSPPTQQLQPASQTPHGQVSPAPDNSAELGRRVIPLSTPPASMTITIDIVLNIKILSQKSRNVALKRLPLDVLSAEHRAKFGSEAAVLRCSSALACHTCGKLKPGREKLRKRSYRLNSANGKAARSEPARRENSAPGERRPRLGTSPRQPRGE